MTVSTTQPNINWQVEQVHSSWCRFSGRGPPYVLGGSLRPWGGRLGPESVTRFGGHAVGGVQGFGSIPGHRLQNHQRMLTGPHSGGRVLGPYIRLVVPVREVGGVVWKTVMHGYPGGGSWNGCGSRGRRFLGQTRSPWTFIRWVASSSASLVLSEVCRLGVTHLPLLEEYFWLRGVSQHEADAVKTITDIRLQDIKWSAHWALINYLPQDLF